LVTNYHVASGRNSNDGMYLNEFCEPQYLDVEMYRVTEERGSLQRREPVILRVTASEYKDSVVAGSTWYEHPNGRQVDIAVFPMRLPPDVYLKHVNDPMPLLWGNPKLYPGIEMFVLGYPLGLSGGELALPIWKRATLATEPSAPQRGGPHFLIDTATREGMSGSPVFACERATLRSRDSGVTASRGFAFSGVYSGRAFKDDFGAQLGYVWTEQAIIEAIEQVPGGAIAPSELV
jgi:Trypsin-like peptidase domain